MTYSLFTLNIQILKINASFNSFTNRKNESRRSIKRIVYNNDYMSVRKAIQSKVKIGEMMHEE